MWWLVIKQIIKHRKTCYTSELSAEFHIIELSQGICFPLGEERQSCAVMCMSPGLIMYVTPYPCLRNMNKNKDNWEGKPVSTGSFLASCPSAWHRFPEGRGITASHFH